MTHQIGDRVRVIRSKHDQSFVGLESVVVGLRDSNHGNPCCEVDLRPSEYVLSHHPSQKYALFKPDDLVPIVDDASWEKLEEICGWKPKRARA